MHSPCIVLKVLHRTFKAQITRENTTGHVKRNLLWSRSDVTTDAPLAQENFPSNIPHWCWQCPRTPWALDQDFCWGEVSRKSRRAESDGLHWHSASQTLCVTQLARTGQSKMAAPTWQRLLRLQSHARHLSKDTSLLAWRAVHLWDYKANRRLSHSVSRFSFHQ